MRGTSTASKKQFHPTNCYVPNLGDEQYLILFSIIYYPSIWNTGIWSRSVYKLIPITA